MIGKIRITKEFDFEMAHALDFHNGKCKNIHGHSYKLSVTLLGAPKQDSSSDSGMVMDFKDLKSIINELIIDELDHALMLQENSPYLAVTSSANTPKLVTTSYQPTCENMLLDFASRITNAIPEDLKLIKLTLRETASGYAEWYAKDQA